MASRVLLPVSSALVLAMASIAAAPAGHAQTPPAGQTNHDTHHPNADAGAKSGNEAKPGMGMMGQGGKSGMMGDDDCMAGMMRGRAGTMGQNATQPGDMQMMPMMRHMMAVMSAESGMMGPHVEGRIAELKAALKITDAQMPQWNRFAEALRGVGKTMGEMHQQMMQSGQANTLPDRLARREKMLTAHLASVKSLEEALQPLYVSLSDEQKKIADKLMIGPMGMM